MSKFSKLLRIFTQSKDLNERRFDTERRLLNGKRVKIKTNQPSVLFFTIHKAASSYVNQVLSDVVRAADYLTADFNGYSFANTSSKLELCDRHFPAHGIYFGALREAIAISNGKTMKTIVHLRDPRDAITSRYFSIYSHRAPNDETRRRAFEKSRQEASQMGIDQYVLENAATVLSPLMAYAEDHFNRPDVLTVHYEDMVNDFSAWLDRIIEYLELPKTNRLKLTVDRVKSEANFDVEKEDIQQHKRQVTPGDHSRKLQPATIRELDQEFTPYFQALVDSDNLPMHYRFPNFDNLSFSIKAA